MNALWEILVPTEKRVKTEKLTLMSPEFYAAWRIKNSYSTRYHREWDAKARKISGGLTIMAPVKGEWESREGELFRERMIPVRFIAPREQANMIVDMTMEYYDQLAILYYKLSDEVILKHREQ